MTAASPSDEAGRWLDLARDDLSAAEDAATTGRPAPQIGCYLAQQAVEKAFKAILVLLQIRFPFSHDLDDLRDLIPPGWHVKVAHPHLVPLTRWAIEARYPGNWPEATDADARATARLARDVWETVLLDLDQHGFDTSPLR